MTWVVATDLNDALLQRLCGTYLNDVQAWIVQVAADLGVLQADILSVLPARAKRVAVLRLAYLTCLGETGTNQHTMNANGQDVFAVKLKFYQSELELELGKLTAADFSGSEEPAEATPSICAEIERG